MKTSGDVAVAEVVGKLQEVRRGRPPPWLRKAMAAADGGAPDAECTTVDE